MEMQLKPCPFCGNTYISVTQGKQYHVMLQNWHDKDEEIYQPWTVSCNGCNLQVKRAACNAEHGGASGAQKAARLLCIEAWNTRTNPDADKYRLVLERIASYNGSDQAGLLAKQWAEKALS